MAGETGFEPATYGFGDRCSTVEPLPCIVKSKCQREDHIMYNSHMASEEQVKSRNNLSVVEIYSDGACSGNPGPGGWAAILRFGNVEKEISGFEEHTTNNRMELTAALMGLRSLNRPCRVKLYSDSAYLVSAFNERWLDNWQRNSWKNAAGTAVSNIDLWKELLKENDRHQISWIKVKGHSNHEMNDRVDQLAVNEIKKNT